MKNKTIVFLILICFISETAESVSVNELNNNKDSLETKIDTMIARMGLSSSTPGGVVGVIKNGRFIFAKAYGLANFETKEPNKISTLFNLASVSKQFTGAAILKLANEKKLSLKDDIRKYLPDFPDYGYAITIGNLIHHTCGIRSFDVLELMAGTLFTSIETQESVYGTIVSQSALNFKPGDEYMYTNSGYFLLAKIVENVTGNKFSKYIEEDIFRPTGMKNTFIYDTPDMILNNCANGHSWGDEEKFKTTKKGTSFTVGESNVYASLEDFLQWDNNFYKNKLGKWNFWKEMTTLTTLNDGDTCDYAFGLEISEHNGLKTVSHQGGMMDFTDQYVQIPSEHLSVVCLFNIPVNVTDLAYGIIDTILKEAPKTDKIAINPEIKADSTVMKLYTGQYFSDEHGYSLMFTRENDHLFCKVPFQEKFELYPSSDTSFFAKVADLKFAFRKNASGESESIIFQNNEKYILKYLGNEEYTLKPGEFAEFTGDFFSNEINVTYPVLIKDNKLYVKFPEAVAKWCHIDAETEIISNHGDYFDSPLGSIQFTRDNRNEVSGFIIKDLGRVRNLAFRKLNK